ncbi:MAG: hypothetical protein ACP5GU_02270 [Thermoprotei archaeon]
MIDFKASLKSGFLSGIFYGLLNAAVTYVFFTMYREAIISEINASLPQNSTMSAVQLYNTVLFLGPVMNMTLGLFGGLVMGIVFGVFYDKIPLQSYMIKGALISLVVWLITNVSKIMYLFSGDYYVILGLIIALVSGGLLGILYKMFSIKPQVEQPSAAPETQGPPSA